MCGKVLHLGDPRLNNEKVKNFDRVLFFWKSLDKLLDRDKKLLKITRQLSWMIFGNCYGNFIGIPYSEIFI